MAELEAREAAEAGNSALELVEAEEEEELGEEEFFEVLEAEEKDLHRTLNSSAAHYDGEGEFYFYFRIIV